MILCGFQYVASLDPIAYFYGDAKTDSVSKSIPILFPETKPEPISILKLILEPILEPIPIPEPILEPIPEPIPESIPETDSGPTIRNRFQKSSELAGIYSDENFIFPSQSAGGCNYLWAEREHRPPKSCTAAAAPFSPRAQGQRYPMAQGLAYGIPMGDWIVLILSLVKLVLGWIFSLALSLSL